MVLVLVNEQILSMQVEHLLILTLILHVHVLIVLLITHNNADFSPVIYMYQQSVTIKLFCVVRHK